MLLDGATGSRSGGGGSIVCGVWRRCGAGAVKSFGEKMMRKWFDGVSGVESPIDKKTWVSPTLPVLTWPGLHLVSAMAIFLMIGGLPSRSMATNGNLIQFAIASDSQFATAKLKCGFRFKQLETDGVMILAFHALYQSKFICKKGKRGKVCLTYPIRMTDGVCSQPFYMSDSGIYIDIEYIDHPIGFSFKIPDRIRKSKSLQTPIATNSIGSEIIILETKRELFIQGTE